jgi:hypothetical protein
MFLPQGFVIRGMGFSQSILRRNNPEPLMSALGQFARQQSLAAHVRFGSFATRSSQQQVGPCPLCPDSNQIPHLAEMTLWAIFGPSALQQK